jgi:cytoskeletal protein CcmA (bactofilin family)
MFTRKTETAATQTISQTICRPEPSTTFMPTQPALFLPGVSIKGSVTLNELLIDGEVEGTIDSTGTLTLGIRAYAVTSGRNQ